jgi:hypothetical protein
MKNSRWMRGCLLLVLSLLLSAPAAYRAHAQAAGIVYFSETGHNLFGEFLQKFLSAPEPLLVYGYPITEQFKGRDGRLAQYFQRARFEFHPELPEGQRVRNTPLGRALYSPLMPLDVNNPAECEYFAVTAVRVCFDFLQFFRAHGGVAQFGYPISPFEFHDGLVVQYFENARLEWQPSLPQGRQVALTLLGRIYFDRAGEDPGLLARVPALLGMPTLPPEPSATFLPQPTALPPPTFEVHPTVVLEVSASLTETSTGVPASETASPSPTASEMPTSTATFTARPTETPMVTVVPTYALLRGDVLVQANCRYGPGQPYLYKYGLYRGYRMEIIGRNDAGTWVYVRAIGGNNPCWVKASLLEIQGDVQGLESLYPDKAPLPKSPYYPPLTGARAARSGDQVRITWTGVTLRAGDEESPTSPLYVAEVWVCRGGQLVFTPIGAYDNVVTVTDEAGCALPSHGRVFLAEKHGYAGPTEIPWPAR